MTTKRPPRSKKQGSHADVQGGNYSHGAAIETSFNPLPKGSRDLLAESCERRLGLRERLLQACGRWGYQRVHPPMLEYFDVQARGLNQAEQDRCVRFIEADTGELVSLRADFTPQIARIVAQQEGGQSSSKSKKTSIRYCYAGDIVRVPELQDGGAEQHQVGIELINVSSAYADAEVLALCHAMLKDLGLQDYCFDLAHVGIVRQMMGCLTLSEARKASLHDRLAKKDRAGVLDILRAGSIDEGLSKKVVALCDLHGGPEILEQAKRELKGLGVGKEIRRLQQVCHGLKLEDPDAWSKVVIDLGEVRGHDYYSGLRLRVWAPGVSHPLVRGGRYDHLLARYGRDLTAVGMGVDLDAVELALEVAGANLRSEKAEVRHMVVVPGHSRADRWVAVAANICRRARKRGHCAWIESGLSVAQALAAADAKKVQEISYFAGKEAASEDILYSQWRRRKDGWRETQKHLREKKR